MAWWLGSTGVPAGIGSASNIGPGGAHAGKIVGLRAGIKHGPEIAYGAGAVYDALRNHDDSPVPPIVGSLGRRTLFRRVRPLQPSDGWGREKPATP
jgi:hypothetical protein